MKNDDLSEKISNALSKTGFILERLISDLLEENKWSIINNRYYLDVSTNTQREMDLLAYKTSSYEGIRHYFVLIISCKKSENYDWVFLTKPVKEADPNFVKYPQTMWTNSGILQATNTIEKIEKDIKAQTKSDIDFKNLFDFENNIYAFQEINIATEKPQNDKKIYSSIDSLLKAAHYEMLSQQERKKEAVIYHFNLLTVFDGNMYEAIVSTDNPIVYRTDNLKYVNRFIINTKDDFYRLHFCTKEYFTNLLKSFEKYKNWEQKQIEYRINEFKKYFLSNKKYRNIFQEKILRDLSPLIWILIQNTTKIKNRDSLNIWLEHDLKVNELNIEIEESEDNIELLNKSKYLKTATENILKKYCKYTGNFKYTKINIEDFPF